MAIDEIRGSVLCPSESAGLLAGLAGGLLGEVAVADCENHRVQVFNSEGNYKQQCGIEGKEEDSQFDLPTSLASDAHDNLLVVDCTNRLPVFEPAACLRRTGPTLIRETSIGTTVRPQATTTQQVQGKGAPQKCTNHNLASERQQAHARGRVPTAVPPH
jgi:hypothetical protein